MFYQVKLYFADSTWQVGENLSTRAVDYILPHQATAVYRCKQVEPNTGEEATVKIHMQYVWYSLWCLPFYLGMHPLEPLVRRWCRIPRRDAISAETRATQATSRVNIIVDTELKLLTHLTQQQPARQRLDCCHIVRFSKQMKWYFQAAIFCLTDGKTSWKNDHGFLGLWFWKAISN